MLRHMVVAGVLLTAGCGASAEPTTTSNEAAGSSLASEITAPTATPAAQSEADADEAVEPTAPALPVTIVDDLGNEVTIDSVDRIIPLDGTVAEVVFALGLGDNVVATDLSATYPPEADALPEIGYQRALTAEAIASFAPTVLLATDIAGPPEVIDDLRRLGFPLVIVPNEATPDGPADKIRAVATALGVSERGEALAAELEATIDEHRVATATDGPVVAALYLRGAGTQFILGEESATHWLIEAAGGSSAAALMGIEDGAPLAAEALLVAAPDVLLIPEAGLASVGGLQGLADLPALSQTPAVINGNVLVYDDQLLLGNGPRTGELLASLVDELTNLTTN